MVVQGLWYSQGPLPVRSSLVSGGKHFALETQLQEWPASSLLPAPSCSAQPRLSPQRLGVSSRTLPGLWTLGLAS